MTTSPEIPLDAALTKTPLPSLSSAKLSLSKVGFPCGISYGSLEGMEKELLEDSFSSLETLSFGKVSQEESGTISARPRSVMNVFLLISTVLLQKCFSLSIKHPEKKELFHILLFIFEKPSKTRKIRVICRDFCKTLSLYSVYNAFDYIWIVKSVH